MPGRSTAWRHSTTVAGASARFPDALGQAGPRAGAKEDATAGLRLRAVLQPRRIKAAWGRTITFRRSTVQPGFYAFAIRFSAAMSPSRVTVLASKPFRVTAPRR